MDVIEKIEELEGKKEFKNWRKTNKHSFLSYVMRVVENPPNDEWQVGFFDREKDKITTFGMTPKAISINSDEDVFKKEEEVIEEIERSKVKVSLMDAVDASRTMQEKKFPAQKPIKIISILQHLPELGTVWNVTYVTTNFSTLNFKISSENKKILDTKETKLFEFHK